MVGVNLFNKRRRTPEDDRTHGISCDIPLECTGVFRHILSLRSVEAPAEVCPNCGEAYTDGATTQRLLDIAHEARRGGVQVDVRRFVAA